MTIDTMLEGDSDAVLLQGPDGIGKTTLLNGYVRSHADDTACLFLRPIRMSYEVTGVIPELYAQLYVALKQTPYPLRENPPTRPDLAALIQRLAARLLADGRHMTIVVDGLADVWARDKAAAHEIFSLLPIGRSGFRFLFSGDIEELLRSFRCVWHPFRLTLFSLDETRQLFSGLGVPIDAIAHAQSACNGVVAHLAAVRRLCCTGLAIDDILRKQPGDLANTMALEWERATGLTTQNPYVVAVITFDARRHTVETLSDTVQVPKELLEPLLADATFLSTSSTGTIDFISDTFRTFAQRRLAALRQSTLERLIASLRASRSATAVTALPLLMADAKQHDELISLIDAEYFRALVSTTQSIGDVAALAGLGAESAERREDDVEVYRFRLIQSLAADVLRNPDLANETRALIALGRTTEALTLARAAAFREERLILLAGVLSELADGGTPIDAALRDELRQLCRSIPMNTISDDIVALAGDVFAVDPEAAVDLVERFGTFSKRTHVFDWVMASMSVRHTIEGRHSAFSDAELSRAKERIADPTLRTVFENARLIGSNSDAEWILGKAALVQEPSKRLTLLRLWLELNSDRTEAISVAREAVELAIKTREFTPSVSILRQFAAPLPHFVDGEAARDLLQRIDALATSLSQRAPSEEYTRLQLLLAETQKRLGLNGYRARLLELYMFVGQLPDLAVRANCLAHLYAQLPLLEPDRLHGDVRDEFVALVREVLRHSASQEDVLEPILRPLVPQHLALAVSLIDQVNTDSRRDRLRAVLTDEFAERPTADPGDLDLIGRELEKIANWRSRGRATVGAMSTASRRGGVAAVALGLRLWQHIDAFVLPEQRAAFLAHLTRLLGNDPKGTEARDQLRAALALIRAPRERSEAALLAIRELAGIDRPAAEEFLSELRSHREGQATPVAAVTGLSLSLRLATRALRGVFASGRGYDEELVRILDLCALVPDIIARISALGELCFAVRASGRTDLSDRLHDEYLAPALVEAKDESLGRYWHSLALAGWSLFYRHERAFLEEVGLAPEAERERILRRTIRTILHGVPPTEPSDDEPDIGRVLTHRNATDILALLAPTSDDALIYDTIRTLCRNAVRRDSELSRAQKADLQQAFGKVVASKLPSPNKIKHEGYKWACLAELNCLSDSTELEWRELVDYARDVPNLPDAAYTLMLVAAAIPTKHSVVREKATHAALALARSIGIASEKAECLINVADEVWRWDTNVAKLALKEAGRAINDLDDSDGEESLSRLLDLAHRISPEFAIALSSELDTEAARDGARRRSLSRAKEALNLRKSMLDESDSTLPALGPDDGETLASAAWRNLASLNVGALSAKPARSLRKSLEAASRWPVGSVYPVFAWTVQNWVERPANASEKPAILRALSQVNLISAELVRLLVAGAVRSTGGGKETPDLQAVAVISPGKRSRALEMIDEWCGRSDLSYVKISDPYFGPGELDLLKIIAAHEPGCRVHVLTSRKHLRSLKIEDEKVALAFQLAWSRISGEPPPPTDVTVAGLVPHGKGPIHDRWWIAAGSALDFGTSANSLGMTQESAIKVCGASVSAEMEKTLDKYLLRLQRFSGETRIDYVTISL